MDRKLSHSLIALSATALFLAVALFAATPVSRTVPNGATAVGTPDASVDDAAETARRDRRSARGGHRGLALPYFSFAHGMRRIGG